jgi:hypothetical protein
MVTAWVRLATENNPLAVSGAQSVRYGDGLHWLTKTVDSFGTCSNAYFGSDPSPQTPKFCEVQVTVPAVTQTGLMPVVNKALLPAPSVPYTSARVQTLSATQLASAPYQVVPGGGAFRIPCDFSHMSFDDPIVYPGQPGMAHLHTFIGNAQADASSTAASLQTGTSTCAGGTANRTAYWLPSLIDVRTGQPLVPTFTNFYYKAGYQGVPAAAIRAFPPGLRMIAGDSAAKSAPTNAYPAKFACISVGKLQQSIPNCPVGDELGMAVVFPQCWDGINLDSPDHKSHMAYGTGSGCPASHPVALPEITLNVHYRIAEANTGDFYKLSSDNYSGPGGYSLHADWFGAWDPAINQAFVSGCINALMDCHDYLLGDGRMLY